MSLPGAGLERQKTPAQRLLGCSAAPRPTHGFMSFGFSIRLTSANLRVFLALPMAAGGCWPLLLDALPELLSRLSSEGRRVYAAARRIVCTNKRGRSPQLGWQASVLRWSGEAALLAAGGSGGSCSPSPRASATPDCVTGNR